MRIEPELKCRAARCSAWPRACSPPRRPTRALAAGSTPSAPRSPRRRGPDPRIGRRGRGARRRDSASSACRGPTRSAATTGPPAQRPASPPTASTAPAISPSAHVSTKPHTTPSTAGSKTSSTAGAEKIHAEEVEELMMRHSDVTNAALVTMPDPVLGERACAFLVMAPGAETLTVDPSANSSCPRASRSTSTPNGSSSGPPYLCPMWATCRRRNYDRTSSASSPTTPRPPANTPVGSVLLPARTSGQPRRGKRNRRRVVPLLPQ